MYISTAVIEDQATITSNYLPTSHKVALYLGPLSYLSLTVEEASRVVYELTNSLRDAYENDMADKEAS